MARLWVAPAPCGLDWLPFAAVTHCPDACFADCVDLQSRRSWFVWTGPLRVGLTLAFPSALLSILAFLVHKCRGRRGHEEDLDGESLLFDVYPTHLFK